MGYSLPGSSIHGIFQARVLEGGASAFSGCFLSWSNCHSVYLSFQGRGSPPARVMNCGLQSPKCFCISWVLFSSVQSLSHVQLFATPWTTACQASLSITNSQSLLKFISIESVMPSNHLILCHPLLQPSIFPSIRVFSNESALCIR